MPYRAKRVLEEMQELRNQIGSTVAITASSLSQAMSNPSAIGSAAILDIKSAAESTSELRVAREKMQSTIQKKSEINPAEYGPATLAQSQLAAHSAQYQDASLALEEAIKALAKADVALDGATDKAAQSSAALDKAVLARVESTEKAFAQVDKKLLKLDNTDRSFLQSEISLNRYIESKKITPQQELRAKDIQRQLLEARPYAGSDPKEKAFYEDQVERNALLLAQKGATEEQVKKLTDTKEFKEEVLPAFEAEFTLRATHDGLTKEIEPLAALQESAEKTLDTKKEVLAKETQQVYQSLNEVRAERGYKPVKEAAVSSKIAPKPSPEDKKKADEERDLAATRKKKQGGGHLEEMDPLASADPLGMAHHKEYMRRIENYLAKREDKKAEKPELKRKTSEEILAEKTEKRAEKKAANAAANPSATPDKSADPTAESKRSTATPTPKPAPPGAGGGTKK